MLKNNLGEDRVFPLVLKLAIPAMLAQFVNVLYTIVDRFFVSQIPDIGDLALASVGVVSPITTFIISFAFLVGLGGAPLMAIKMGEQNNQRAEKILFNCVFSLFVVSVILMILGYSLKNYFLVWFGASSKTFPLANEYITYYLIGTIFAVCGLGLNSFITAQGYSAVSMTFVIISALTNILLDYVFIMILKMGVKGAAVATVIAQAVGFLLMFGFLLSKKSKIRIKFQKLDFSIIKKVMIMGFGPFFINSTDSLLIILLNTVLQKAGGAEMGDIYLSAITIVVSFFQLVTNPLNGITMGTQPIISYNYGAKKIKRVKSAMISIVSCCVVFCLSMTLFSQLGADKFVFLFTDNPVVAEVAVKWIKIYCAGVMCLAIQYPTVDMMVAMGQALPSASMSFNRKMAIAVLTATLPLALGANGGVIAEPIGDGYSMIVSGILFIIVARKALKKREQEQIIIEP